MVTRAIERAQKQVEMRNFETRKHLLEYDDVNNKQRNEIYSLRRGLLEGKDQKAGPGGGQDFASGMGEFATRELIMDYHMKHVATMAAKLQAVPEGDGTMLDNTLILYLSDHGEKHHSNCYEWPMVALGNIDRKLKAGHYVHVPGWGEAGHRTIANLYMSLLHAAGLPRDDFGQPDRTLPESIDQAGPLAEWMA